MNDLVLEMQKITEQTYLFMKLYILYKFHNKKELPIVDKLFVQYCIRTLGTRSNKGKKSENIKLQQELNDFYEKEFKPQLNGKEKFNLINKKWLTNYLTVQISTNFNNNLKEHFITRIQRFLNIINDRYKLTEDKKIWTYVKNSILFDNIEKCPEDHKEFAIKFKKHFLPKEYTISFFYDCKVNPSKYLKYAIRMNKKMEEWNDELNGEIQKETEKITIKQLQSRKKKLFQPISLRTSIIPSYITIDTCVILYNFEFDLEEKTIDILSRKIKDNFNFIWNSVFNIDKKVFKKKGYQFTSIQTDGIGASIRFQNKNCKKKYEKGSSRSQIEENDVYIDELINSERDILQNRKLVVVDPGKQVLSQMMDEKGNKLRYTAAQRRIESTSKRNKGILEREKIKYKIQNIESQLSDSDCKTVNYNKFKDYIKRKVEMNDKLRTFYNQLPFRKMKFRHHVYNRKSEDKFLNKIESTFGKRDEILISYGDWSRSTQMKGIAPTMGIGLRKLIAKKFDLVLVDEFKSSCLCHRCHRKTNNYQGKHRLLVCRECSGCESKNTVIMNRDINACYNLITISRDIIDGKGRPEVFSRNKKTLGNESTIVDAIHYPKCD